MRAAIAATAAVTACALVAGCARGGPHVQLWAPPPSASFAERHAAYHALRPAEVRKHAPFFAFNDTRPGTYLVLGDGRQVWHVGDLRAVVEPHSQTAREANTHDRGRTQRTLGILLFSVSMAAGAGLIIHGVDGADRGGDPVAPPAVIIPLGAVVMLGGMTTGITIALRGSKRAAAARPRALDSYDADLRARLRLCLVVGIIAECPPGGR